MIHEDVKCVSSGTQRVVLLREIFGERDGHSENVTYIFYS